MKSSCEDCRSSTPIVSQGIETTWAKEGKYKDFSEELHSSAYPRRIPTDGAIEIIENCNFNCIHCYQGKNKSKSFLPASKWISILDEMAEAGTLWLLITGGEALMHPEFAEIYTAAVKKGFIVTLFTNARMIKDSHIELFNKYPPFSIEVTYYGTSNKKYKEITGSAKAFDIVLENCKKLIKAGLPLKIKTMAMKPMLKEVPLIREIANELGVPFAFDTKIDPGIYGEDLTHLRASYKDISLLEEKEVSKEAITKDLVAFIEFNKKNVKEAKSEDLLYRCGAGKNTFYIDFKGIVHTCSIGRIYEADLDLNKISFHKIWHELLVKIVYQEAPDLNENCKTCEFRGMCDACPATAKLSTGSVNGRPMYICQQTMERKQHFLEGTKYSNYQLNIE